jgi:hypothetical protein
MLTCGFTGGKKEIVWGVGGRETVGKCTSEESAAEDEEDEMAESVRLRSCTDLGGPLTGGTGRVATDRADETEVRRSCDEDDGLGEDGDNEPVFILVGDVDITSSTAS